MGRPLDRAHDGGRVRSHVAGGSSGPHEHSYNISVVLRRHVLPTLGDRALVSVRPSDVQALVKALSATLAPGTVGQVVKVVRRLFAAAGDDRLIPSSPCAKLRSPQDARPPMVVPTVDEINALAGAVPERYRALVVLLAGSGLRIGEALGLDVGHVDLLRRTVRVERQRHRDGSLGPTKTASSARIVPLGQVVIDELAAHLARYADVEVNKPLFTNELGEPLTYGSRQATWNRTRTRLGLDLDTHDLRHFTASALIGGGASVKQVQAVLGHSTAAQTLTVYSHLWPGDDDRARAVMDAVLAPAAAQVRPTASPG